MDIRREATAIWQGGLKDGKGTVTTQRGALKDTPYNFGGRFEGETTGTNPEELIGAAHAACFSMALSGQLAERGMTAQHIETKAIIKMERIDGKPTVTASHLDVTCTIPNADRAKFQEATEATKAGCPVSRLLAPGLTITLDARLN